MRNTRSVHTRSRENQIVRVLHLLVAIVRSPHALCEGITRTKLFSMYCLLFRRPWNLWTDFLAPLWSFFYILYSTWRVFINTGASVGSLTWDSAPQFCAQRNSKIGLSLLGKERWNQSTWKEYPVLKEYSWQSQESAILRAFSFTLYLFQFYGSRSNSYLLLFHLLWRWNCNCL